MRIGIVNDMDMACAAMRQVIAMTAGLEFAWEAHDGQAAIDHCAQDTPDLILMDLYMPVMDGVEATRQIMARSPCPILVVTSSVEDHAAMVFEAMGAGALDAVSTPTLVSSDGELQAKELVHKIRTIGKLLNIQTLPRCAPPVSDRWLLAIGSSTGGPNALAAILSRLPANIQLPVAIIQHVDEAFAGGLGDWLNKVSSLPVRVAREGDQLEPGKVLLAGTNNHMVYTRLNNLSYTPEPVSLVYRPSVDVFFDSLAQYWQGNIIAVLLTGMGRDGAEGMLKLKRKGAYTIAQNQDTCAVFGMPKAAIELHAADAVLPIDDIAQAILRHLTTNSNLVKRNTAV